MKNVEGENEQRTWRKYTFFAFLVLIPLFLAMAAVPKRADRKARPLDRKWYDPVTARADVLKTKTMVGNCYICHMIYVPDPAVRQPQFTHKEIVMEHGGNDRCYNCHYIRDRNKFTPDYGDGIAYHDIERLCEKCHGVIYRDWKAGTHGLRQGKWLPADRILRAEFKCTQCHNPHKPVFKYADIAPTPVWPERHVRKRHGALSKLSHSSEYLTEIKEIF